MTPEYSFTPRALDGTDKPVAVVGLTTFKDLLICATSDGVYVWVRPTPEREGHFEPLKFEVTPPDETEDAP